MLTRATTRLRTSCLNLTSKSKHVSMNRQLSSTATKSNSDDVDPVTKFAQNRNIYRKEVSNLRKQYAVEIAAERRADEARKAAERQKIAAEKQKRVAKKLERSIQNARLDHARKAARRQQWLQELEQAKIKRLAREERYMKARRLLLQELEEEAPLWMTTKEEVEEKLSDEQFWHRPSLVGARPDDAVFWKYEGLHQDKSKTYLTPRDKFYQHLLDHLYLESNCDAEYWANGGRLEQYEERAERAKLRSLVRSKGRKRLEKTFDDPFKDEKFRNRRQLLAALEIGADEVEGVKMLLSDPTQFFEQVETKTLDDDEEVIVKTEIKVKSEKGFPEFLFTGRQPYTAKALLEREKAKKSKGKKKQQQLSKADKKPMETDFDEDTELDPEILAALDLEEEDEEMSKLPVDERISDDDIAWIIQQLKDQIARMEEKESVSQVISDVGIISAEENEIEEIATASSTPGEMDGVEESFEDDFDEDIDYDVMSSMTAEQQEQLSRLDFQLESPEDAEKLADAIREHVSDLNEQQIRSLVYLELILFENDGTDDGLQDFDLSDDGKDKDK
eukprot:CAMPEP_0196818694 /NCGR_PEP_ID=MMETSP1362-20130617/66929_1 /TAXON_ID=163516 /ORGANISM="Leptocylindrus danicus, Strain CCMP1856" /LENGTH=560 /DNA_ID=CAMNT_0042196893 /DNA_START=268 /DNA_END=1947 /DNA_ORIENTATION=-